MGHHDDSFPLQLSVISATSFLDGHRSLVSAARRGSLAPTQFRKDRGNMPANAEVEQDSALRHVAKEGGLLRLSMCIGTRQ